MVPSLTMSVTTEDVEMSRADQGALAPVAASSAIAPCTARPFTVSKLPPMITRFRPGATLIDQSDLSAVGAHGRTAPLTSNAAIRVRETRWC